MIKVNFISRIPQLIQGLQTEVNYSKVKDNLFQAIKDVHNGILALKNSVESTRINSESPFGPIDGKNVIFNSTQEPAFIVVNSAGVTSVKINGVDFNYGKGKVKFLTGAPPSKAVMKSFYV